MASRVLPSGALITSRLVVKMPRLLDELQRPVERFGAAIERHFKECAHATRVLRRAACPGSQCGRWFVASW